MTAAVLGLSATASHAAITANNNINTSVTGVVSNRWTVDTDSDWLGAVVFVELTSGTVNFPLLPGDFITPGPPGPGVTFVWAADNGNVLIAGGAVDLGDPSAQARFGPDVLGVTWAGSGADTDDIGAGLLIGQFAFTDDSTGTWQLLVVNAADDQTLLSGVVINGAMVPEPTTLCLLGFGGLALLKRKK